MTAKPKSKRLPRGFRRGHDDSLACPHRDISCCDACAKAHEEIVDVYGNHYWIPDPIERSALVTDMKDDDVSPAGDKEGR